MSQTHNIGIQMKSFSCYVKVIFNMISGSRWITPLSTILYKSYKPNGLGSVHRAWWVYNHKPSGGRNPCNVCTPLRAHVDGENCGAKWTSLHQAYLLLSEKKKVLDFFMFIHLKLSLLTQLRSTNEWNIEYIKNNRLVCIYKWWHNWVMHHW